MHHQMQYILGHFVGICTIWEHTEDYMKEEFSSYVLHMWWTVQI